ncbi:hypothetical protein [Actinophytocola sp. NPDC049390]|uniref:hypothetical protein n=1 Tax=Actinophytocola sp. NPDC049390 TaxID=3363894 RepID=UPI0037A138AE
MATLDVLTLAEGKAAVKQTATTASDDEIKRWITAVSLRLDELVGPVVRRAVTDELDGGDCSVFLTKYPVASITSVKEYDRDGTETVLTAETNPVKPADGYRTRKYSGDPTLLGNELLRRDTGYAAEFAAGEGNVVVEYTAGRFATTADVDERFKAAAKLMMKNVWRSEMTATQNVDEYDVPQSNFPTYVISKAVKDLFPGELQGHYL